MWYTNEQARTVETIRYYLWSPFFLLFLFSSLRLEAPTITALKAGKNRASRVPNETKREISLRDFPRHFPPPRHELSITGLGFPVNILDDSCRRLVESSNASSPPRESVEFRILFTGVQQADFYPWNIVDTPRSNVERVRCVVYRGRISPGISNDFSRNGDLFYSATSQNLWAWFIVLARNIQSSV